MRHKYFTTAILTLTAPAHAINALENANHVFNTVHSSMRQWGSSLNHNGMSFFLATVPAHTPLYHGTFRSDPVTSGLQWLAFEPEHALIFARPRHAGPPLNPKPDPGDEMYGEKLVEWWARLARLEEEGKTEDEDSEGFVHRANVKRSQIVLQDEDVGEKIEQEDEDSPKYGYLHTYSSDSPLNLLYIDGMSAGKTLNGTLDSQDLLLLNWTATDPIMDMWRERERAQGVCDLARDVWGGRIDGVIRMEGGFEIIVCDFGKTVEVQEIMPVLKWTNDRMMGGWSYYKAIAQRYHGIGGGRVKLDYENFVTVFDYPDLDIWNNDVHSDIAMPRLRNVKVSQLTMLRDAVTRMIMADKGTSENGGRNWQEIVDMVVTRFSSALHYLHTDKAVRERGDQFADLLAAVLRPYIDYSSRNSALETERCVGQIVPRKLSSNTETGRGSSGGLAHRAIYDVTSRICSTLLSAYKYTLPESKARPMSGLSNTSSPPIEALELVDGLVAWLQWTTWKECQGCRDEELCMIPIWPVGAWEDHKTPRCRDEASARERRGYWG